jgi:vacuolar-type H+-ATPase subunit I/STV1
MGAASTELHSSSGLCVAASPSPYDLINNLTTWITLNFIPSPDRIDNLVKGTIPSATASIILAAWYKSVFGGDIALSLLPLKMSHATHYLHSKSRSTSTAT